MKANKFIQSPWVKVVGGVATLLFGVLIGRWLGQSGDSNEAVSLNVVAFAAIFMVLMVFATWMYWRSLDELAREAHKFAWYWGGSIGMACSIFPMLLILQLDGASFVDSEATRNAVFSDGLLLGFILAAASSSVGYIVTWIIYWLRKR